MHLGGYWVDENVTGDDKLTVYTRGGLAAKDLTERVPAFAAAQKLGAYVIVHVGEQSAALTLDTGISDPEDPKARSVLESSPAGR